MTAPFNTLLLDVLAWDLVSDASGNIAMASPPYAQAQDMSTQCRLFRGEYIYDASAGVPYATILGQSPSLGALKADYIAAALTVPDVVSATCFVESVKDRLMSGQVQGKLASGQVVPGTFGA